MDHGFFTRDFFEHESHESHESIWHADLSFFYTHTDLTLTDLLHEIFLNTNNELNEYFILLMELFFYTLTDFFYLYALYAHGSHGSHGSFAYGSF